MLIIGAALAAGLAGCASLGGGGTTGIPGVSVLSEGQQSVMQKPSEEDVHDQAGLDKLWTDAFGGTKNVPAKPTVDWSKNMVVAYFAGKLPTGGYWIEVTRAEEVVGAYDIDFNILVPGPGCHVSDADTRPYIIVQAPASRLPVSFDRRSTIKPPCS